jgi:hypothetical protein
MQTILSGTLPPDAAAGPASGTIFVLFLVCPSVGGEPLPPLTCVLSPIVLEITGEAI